MNLTPKSVKKTNMDKPVPQANESETDSPYCLRSEKLGVSDENFEDIFDLNEFWRPKHYVENDLTDNDDKTVTDKATGLMWKKTGSPDKMTFGETEKYIHKLNNMRFAGHADWRIPTIDELISLIEPETQANGLHVNPIFDSKEKFWSCDSWQQGGGWSVSFGSNLVYCRNSFKKGHIRAVRSLSENNISEPMKKRQSYRIYTEITMPL